MRTQKARGGRYTEWVLLREYGLADGFEATVYGTHEGGWNVLLRPAQTWQELTARPTQMLHLFPTDTVSAGYIIDGEVFAVNDAYLDAFLSRLNEILAERLYIPPTGHQAV